MPFAPIIIKICRAYTNTQEDFEDYYRNVFRKLDEMVAEMEELRG